MSVHWHVMARWTLPRMPNRLMSPHSNNCGSLIEVTVPGCADCAEAEHVITQQSINGHPAGPEPHSSLMILPVNCDGQASFAQRHDSKEYCGL